jgi:hypothetical protein
MHMHLLAAVGDSTFWLVIAVVGIAVLGVAWFGVRFWLASTRPANIDEVPTPTLDRLNRAALEGFGGDDEEEDEEAPEGLKDVMPGDERGQ